MRLYLSYALQFLLLACGCAAQSVRPAVVEYTAAGEGSFEVINTFTVPLFVSVEAKSFTIDPQGTAHFRPLSSSIHLQLSQTSVRLPPLSRRTVFYKATADSYPAWFCVYSDFAGAPHHNSVNINLELPHTVYLLSRDRGGARGVVFDGLRRDGDTLVGTVSNHGPNVVRLEALQVIDDNGKKHDEGGFPLLPGGFRELSLPLRPGEHVERLRAKVGGSVAEGTLR